MKKLLIMIYLSLLISSCNGEERKAVNNKVIDKVNDKNINWVKLTDDSEKDNEIVKNTKEGTAYVEIKGKRLICGKIKNGKRDGNWIYWHNNGVKKYEGTFINGKLEGINCKIKALNRVSYGFGNFFNYKSRILIMNNDLII